MKKTIKEHRKEKGVKSVYMAEQLGLTRAEYSNRECGRTKFTVQEFVRVCTILGIDVNDVDFSNLKS